MSLWSFQGARELGAPALHEAAPRRGSVPQISTACGGLRREPTRETRSTSSRRTGSSDDAEHELEPSTSPAASGVRAQDSLERRGSSRTFRYGYLVTTSPQSSTPPSTAASPKGLAHRLRVLPTFVVCRVVCTRPGNVFTADV